MNRKITFLLTLLFLGYLNVGAQTSCPTNIDFEAGSFSGWSCYTGLYSSSFTPVTWGLTAVPIAGRHDITSGSGTDPYGFFPVVAPGGGTSSAKLGSNATGYLCEKATYSLTVPSTSGIWSLIYRYAVVIENPASHPASVQPRVVVKAYDAASPSAAIACDTYQYVASSTIPSFSLSSVGGSGGDQVYYKPWTYGNLKFPGLSGHTIVVDFEAYDCGYGGHFGYGYFDMTCGFFANSIIGCASGTTVLSGPDGYEYYNWYDSATFTTLYGSSEIISITAPTVTTTYAVILTPYTGYGCPDTLYTRVIPSTLVVTRSHDTTICSGSTVTVSVNATSASTPITYSWAPSTGLSCTTCSSASASPTVTTTYSVTVTDAATCVKTVTINVAVVPMPCAIGGPSTLCPLTTVTETDCAAGGVWTAAPSSVATITPTSGVLSGVTSGTATVIYTTGGICTVSRTVTVNPAPPPISPTAPHVCVGSTTTLTDGTPGGSWSVVAPSSTYVSIGTSSGVVTGLFQGTGTVTYTAPGGCFATRTVTVDPLPATITGSSAVCQGATITMSDITPGGTWSVTPTTTATVNPTTGVVYGASVGPATVTYTLSTGCFVTTTLSVLAPPTPIIGPSNVCFGATGVTYTDATSGGYWGTTNPAMAYVDPATGVMSMYSTGVDTVTYTSYATGCSASMAVTINSNPVITGVAAVCINGTTILTSSVSSTWSSSDTTKARVTPGPSTTCTVTGVASGSVNITTTSAVGCVTVTPILVNPLPNVISGPTSLCQGTCVSLTDATTPGTFTSGTSSIATVTPTGTLCGVAAGYAIISYTSTTTGCVRTTTINVNSTPSAITGVLTVCPGGTTSLSDLVPGGTWSSVRTAVGTIGSSSGVFYGVSSDTVTVVYSLGGSCSTHTVVTVNPVPAPINPTAPALCVGGSLGLTDASSPGSWTSACPTTLSVGSSSGTVTGLGSGTCIVTFTAAATGCSTSRSVTVNPNPLPIAPPVAAVCIGDSIHLTDPTGGGTWSSSSPGVGSIAPATGVAHGVSSGVTTIKYTLGTTCFTSTVLTVNALPSLFSVTGGGAFCAGGAGYAIGLTGSTSGISYQLYLGTSPIGSPVSGTGGAITFGFQTTPGTYTVIATNPVTGCHRTMTGSATITVNPLPPTPVGPTGVCVANTITLTDAMPGGVWHSSNTLAATVTPGPSTTTTVTGVTSGLTTTISYTLPTGCLSTIIVTVTPSPSPISGPSAVCVSACVTLSDTVLGGAWTSTSPATATVTSTGVVCGVAAGVTTISYSLGSGCTRSMTVNVTPAPNTPIGVHSVCSGDTATFHDLTPGGVWSMDPASAGLGTIGTTTGLFTSTAGLTSAAVATISYTASGGTGCGVAYQVTINPVPSPIVGPAQICEGLCGSYTSSPTGGSWSVTPGTSASIGATSGSLCGTALSSTSVIPVTVKYSAAGCATTTVVTLNPLPSPITGPSRVCQASSITLASTPGGGTWTSSSGSLSVIPGPGATTVATGGTPTGVAIVTYTLPTTCARTTAVTVNLTPAPITGTPTICQLHTTALADATPGGTWSSSNSIIASVGSTGIVFGGTSGVATITYTLATCYSTFTVTVTAPPSPIVGPTNICAGGTATYTDPSPGGSWLSTIPAMGSIDASTGVLTGIASGTVIISYGTYGPSGCGTAMAVFINPISAIQGSLAVCQGQTVHLYDTTTGGTWRTTRPSVALINPATGLVRGGTPTVPGMPDTVTVTYTTYAGCSVTAILTVNPAPVISGPAQVCVGNSITCLATPGPGTWTSSAPGIGSINSITGVLDGISPGLTTVTYTLSGGTGCPASEVVTVNALPLPIVGPNSVCVGGYTIALSDYSPGGTWSSSSPSIASVGPLTGIVTSGTTAGTATISYTLGGAGCAATKTVTVTAPPAAPYGSPLAICQGATTTLYDATPGGTWSSASAGVATVDAITGVVTGGSTPGTAVISYSIGTGCSSPITVTVNGLPGPISPFSATLCGIGSTVTMTSSGGSGVWTSSTPSVATIDSFTGLATAIGPGSTVITFTLATGCANSSSLSVNTSVASIAGSPNICIGGTTALSDATPGGAWSSSNPGVASVDPFGVVTGVALGTAVISYNTGAPCVPTMAVTVNAIPGPIGGTLTVCQGASTTLTNATGGSWSSLNPSVASVVSGTGVVTGVMTMAAAPDTATIVFSSGAGCTVPAVVTVNPTPDVVYGPNNVCEGQAITLNDITPGGTWSSSTPSVGSVDVFGDVSGVSHGVTTISYTNSYACSQTETVTVNAQPAPVTGTFNICLGGTVTLHESVPNCTWSSLNPIIASVGSSTGIVTGHIIGTATIMVTDTIGGCFTTQVVHVVALPNVYTVTGGGNHCSDDTGVHIGLTGSSSGINYLVYLGSSAVGTIPGSGAAPFDLGLYTVAGVYTVKGTSTATGCTSTMLGSATVNVTRSVTPSVSMSITPNDTVCAGTSVTFIPTPVNGGTAPTYLWEVNSTPVAVTNSYTFIPANGDTVLVAMTSNTACPTPATVTQKVVMTVNPFMWPSASLTAIPADTVCKGYPVTINATPYFGGTAPVYSWFKNGAPMAGTGPSFTFTPNNNDVVYAEIASNYPCRLSNLDTSAPIVITVDTPRFPLVTINGYTSISAGQTDTLRAVVANAVNPTYQWYVNGLPIAGATSSTFVDTAFSTNKEDSISVAVTNNDICVITSHEWVYIRVHPVGVQQLTTGISDIVVVPNPNKGEFAVKGSLGTLADEDVSLEITDVLGQVVYRSNIVAKNGKLDELIKLKGNVANGMYMLSVHSGTESKVFHVVIEQ